MTWQASPSNKVAALVRRPEPRLRVRQRFGRQRARDALALQGESPVHLAQATLELARHQPVLLEAGGTLRRTTCQVPAAGRGSPGSADHGAIHQFHLPGDRDRALRPQRQQQLQLPRVRVVRDRFPRRQSGHVLHEHLVLADHGTDQSRRLLVRATACPCQLTQFGHADQLRREDRSTTSGSTLQDRWTFNRLTLNLGVRSDCFNVFVEPQSLTAGAVRAGPQLPRVYNVPNWKDVSPRLGVPTTCSATARPLQGQPRPLCARLGIQDLARQVEPERRHGQQRQSHVDRCERRLRARLRSEGSVRQRRVRAAAEPEFRQKRAHDPYAQPVS